ncbi:uncharacterized protein FIBRA_02811 [Fibroporia radiculosa]|uniref:Uncharacterized protein n=1 Tax=Fibroporia radiculosa TaxID=599839 RepID=J4GN49_9APHY|nr:uncharacterized protein FIBRA_02811 [Fibroporia radiculosa]CCM00770.1 predicted protein [Fibroporia radiculosa]
MRLLGSLLVSLFTTSATASIYAKPTPCSDATPSSVVSCFGRCEDAEHLQGNFGQPLEKPIGSGVYDCCSHPGNAGGCARSVDTVSPSPFELHHSSTLVPDGRERAAVSADSSILRYEVPFAHRPWRARRRHRDLSLHARQNDTTESITVEEIGPDTISNGATISSISTFYIIPSLTSSADPTSFATSAPVSDSNPQPSSTPTNVDGSSSSPTIAGSASIAIMTGASVASAASARTGSPTTSAMSTFSVTPTPTDSLETYYSQPSLLTLTSVQTGSASISMSPISGTPIQAASSDAFSTSTERGLFAALVLACTFFCILVLLGARWLYRRYTRPHYPPTSFSPTTHTFETNRPYQYASRDSRHDSAWSSNRLLIIARDPAHPFSPSTPTTGNSGSPIFSSQHLSDYRVDSTQLPPLTPISRMSMSTTEVLGSSWPAVPTEAEMVQLSALTSTLRPLPAIPRGRDSTTRSSLAALSHALEETWGTTESAFLASDPYGRRQARDGGVCITGGPGGSRSRSLTDGVSESTLPPAYGTYSGGRA